MKSQRKISNYFPTLASLKIAKRPTSIPFPIPIVPIMSYILVNHSICPVDENYRQIIRVPLRLREAAVPRKSPPRQGHPQTQSPRRTRRSGRLLPLVREIHHGPHL